MILAGAVILLIVPIHTRAIMGSPQQQEEERSRNITADDFTNARPNRAPNPGAPSPRKRPVYHRVNRPPSAAASARPKTASAKPAAQPTAAAELGVTIWRLRPSRQTDGTGTRMLVRENNRKTEWTPERIGASTQLRVNDRVRLSTESPRAGYLYVVDREEYADGTLGDAYLIYPTLADNNGDNRVQAGRLVDIPAQEQDPNYFTLVPSPSRGDQVGEVLSIIVTSNPIDGLSITDKPLKISPSIVSKWERAWSGDTDEFEMEGGQGQPWTREEREAASGERSRMLSRESPTPQTIYRVETKKNDGLLVTVPLRYRRTG